MAVDPSIIAAGIQAAASAGSALMTTVKKRGSTRMMNVSKELARYNSDLSAEMYRQYQSPAAQVRQYREAGLNPNLLAGGAQSGAPSAGQVNTNAADYGMSSRESLASTAAAAITGAVDRFQTYFLNKAKIENDIASAAALQSQERLNELKARGQEIENSYNEVMNSYRVEDMTMSNQMKAIDLDIKHRYGLIEARAKYQNLLENTYLTQRQRDEITYKIANYTQQIKESEARVKTMRDNVALGFGNLQLAKEKFEFDKDYRTESLHFDQFNANRQYGLDYRNFNLRRSEYLFRRRLDMVDKWMNYTTPSSLYNMFPKMRANSKANAKAYFNNFY